LPKNKKNKSFTAKVRLRVPPPVNDIQVNTCRNPSCENFGRLPLEKVSRSPYGVKDGYRIANGWRPSLTRMLSCTGCGEAFTLKSNLAIVEEFARLWQAHEPAPGSCCPKVSCENHHHAAQPGSERYQRFGSTAVGSPRYRCKACHTTFSIPTKSTHRQRIPRKNALIFRLLLNKVPMRRICEVAGVGPAVLYNRIHFIHQQCEQFSRAREKPLTDGLVIPELHLAVDRQEHVFNWGSHMDRRNTQLAAVASADNLTSYVFGMHLDYDPAMDPYESDLHAREVGDFELEPPFRRYARIWLPGDIEKAAELDPSGTEIPHNLKLPSHGVRVYREYTLFAHFLFLQRLLPGAQKILFFLDQEAGIRAACLTAFRDWVRKGRAEAFLVRIDKSLTVDDKKLALASREQVLAKAGKHLAMTSRWKIAHTLMLREYEQLKKTEKKAQARWVRHPLPHMGEPEKAVCYLSDRREIPSEAVIDMMLHGSLHAVDRYFMQLRRRVSLLERPIMTPSAMRTWHGGSAYNPEVAAKIMDIFRVAFNFTMVGKGQKTPAMRLKLASRPVALDEILRFI
jgi:transposase-like protein